MVKSEGVANSYTKYIHFIHPLDTMAVLLWRAHTEKIDVSV